MYLGTIERSDPEELTLEEWSCFIERCDLLFEAKPRDGINPFTQEKVIFSARADIGYFINNEMQIGYAAWAEDDSSCIVIESKYFELSLTVEKLAIEVASILGAKFIRSVGEQNA
jgi:hypothetical protein